MFHCAHLERSNALQEIQRKYYNRRNDIYSLLVKILQIFVEIIKLCARFAPTGSWLVDNMHLRLLCVCLHCLLAILFLSQAQVPNETFPFQFRIQRSCVKS